MKKHDIWVDIFDLVIGVLQFIIKVVCVVLSVALTGGMYAIIAVIEEDSYLSPFWAKLALFTIRFGTGMCIFMAVVAVLAIIYVFAKHMYKKYRKIARQMRTENSYPWRKKASFFKDIADFIACLKDIALLLLDL